MGFGAVSSENLEQKIELQLLDGQNQSIGEKDQAKRWPAIFLKTRGSFGRLLFAKQRNVQTQRLWPMSWTASAHCLDYQIHLF